MINVSLKVIIKKKRLWEKESKMSFYMWIRFFYCDPKIYHLFLFLVCHYYVCWCFVIINELSCVTVSLSSSYSLNLLESWSEIGETSITYFWHYCYKKKVRLLTFNDASIVIIFLSLNLYCYVLDLSKHVVIIVALCSREQCNEMFLFVYVYCWM